MIKIERVWLKCYECNCAWFDDNESTFAGCPECGGDFRIIDEEIIEFNQEESNG